MSAWMLVWAFIGCFLYDIAKAWGARRWRLYQHRSESKSDFFRP